MLNLIKQGKHIIGCSGGFSWIKGSDLVIPLMIQILKKNNNVHFVWVGGDLTSNEYEELKIDIKNSLLSGHILFTGSVDNPMHYFSMFDIFVLLSVWIISI